MRIQILYCLLNYCFFYILFSAKLNQKSNKKFNIKNLTEAIVSLESAGFFGFFHLSSVA